MSFEERAIERNLMTSPVFGLVTVLAPGAQSRTPSVVETAAFQSSRGIGVASPSSVIGSLSMCSSYAIMCGLMPTPVK